MSFLQNSNALNVIRTKINRLNVIRPKLLIMILSEEKFITENAIGLHHPLDGVTNPKYKLLHFIELTIVFAERRGH